MSTPGPCSTPWNPFGSESAESPLGMAGRAYLSLHVSPSPLGLLRREKGQSRPCGEMTQLMPDTCSSEGACLVPRALPRLE